MFKLLLITLGGAIGTLARYGTQSAMMPVSERFPYGTLAVNLIGCLVIGFLHALFAERLMIRPEYRIAILVGLLGGFTTFSSYGLETLNLLHAAQYARAAVNILAHNIGGLLMVMAGYSIGVRL